MRKFLNYIKITFWLLLLIIMFFSGLGFIGFLMAFLTGVYLWYGAIKRIDNLSIWFIDKKMFYICLSIYSTIIVPYLFIEIKRPEILIDRYSVGPLISNEIVLSFALVAIAVSALLSVKKEKEEDFKVTLSIIKSIPQEKLGNALNSLEESEQKLIKQRFGLEKRTAKGSSKPLSIYDLVEMYKMNYQDLKNWLISVDGKLFKSIERNKVNENIS